MQTERDMRFGLVLALRREDTAAAEGYARKLATRKGQPESWPLVYERALTTLQRGAGAVNASGAARLADPLPAGYYEGAPVAQRAKLAAREAASGVTAFYDRNPKMVLGATVAVSTVAGVKLNKRLGPVTDLELQPSTIAGAVALVAVFVARHQKWRRTANVALAAAAGQGLATVEAHMPEGGILKPKGPRA